MKLVSKMFGMIAVRVVVMACVLVFAALATRYAVNTYATKFPKCDETVKGCAAESKGSCKYCDSSFWGKGCYQKTLVGVCKPSFWKKPVDYTVCNTKTKTETTACDNNKSVPCESVWECSWDGTSETNAACYWKEKLPEPALGCK